MYLLLNTSYKDYMKIKKNKYNRFADILCLILLVGVIVYLIIAWNRIPDKIPGHYNLAGEIDRFGSKKELLVTPIVGWILYIGMTLIESFPQIWNTGVTVTEENRERVFRVIKNMISTLKLIISLDFVTLTVNSSLLRPLPVWLTPVFILLIFGTLIIFVIRLIKVSKSR
jgi:uncharacterized membrane protein